MREMSHFDRDRYGHGELEQFDPYWYERQLQSDDDEESDEEVDCYYCAGTRLHGDGFHDCPVCMRDEVDNYDEDESEE
jgi:hypothetical protein